MAASKLREARKEVRYLLNRVRHAQRVRPDPLSKRFLGDFQRFLGDFRPIFSDF
jgi:hypothetical protein